MNDIVVGKKDYVGAEIADNKTRKGNEVRAARPIRHPWLHQRDPDNVIRQVLGIPELLGVIDSFTE